MIVNLTQHSPTPEQTALGVFDFETDTVRRLLTFQSLPSMEELEHRAQDLAEIALNSGATHAMLGGAPFFMAPLERALWNYGVVPVYAFSQRKSVETVQSDGTVVKTAVFQFEGFVGL